MAKSGSRAKTGVLPVIPHHLVCFILLLTLSSLPAASEGKKGRRSSHKGGREKITRSQNSGPADGKAQPNIVFILTDDQDKHIGYEANLPKITELLKRKGMTFDNFYVDYALCCPSRATILTGRCSHNTGITVNQGPTGGWPLFRSSQQEMRSIAAYLYKLGYRNGLLGKYLNGYKKHNIIPFGWETWLAFMEGGYGFNNWTASDQGKRRTFGSLGAEDYSTDVIARRAVEFIMKKATDPRPFFLFITPYAPHSPAIPAMRHRGRFAGIQVPRTADFNEADANIFTKAWSVRRYPSYGTELLQIFDVAHQLREESMLAVDELVETVVGALQSIGVLDNTYIFQSSDNGFHIGHHRMGGGKQTPYELDNNLPFHVRGPGVPQDVTVQYLVGNTDFLPTFVELAGGVIDPNYPVDGKSLVPLLRADATDTIPLESFRSAFLLEKTYHDTTFQADSVIRVQSSKLASEDLKLGWAVPQEGLASINFQRLGPHNEEYLDFMNDFRPGGIAVYTNTEGEILRAKHAPRALEEHGYLLGPSERRQLASVHSEPVEIGPLYGKLGMAVFPNCINDGAEMVGTDVDQWTLYCCATLYANYIADRYSPAYVETLGEDSALRYVQRMGLRALDYRVAMGFGLPTTYYGARVLWANQGRPYKGAFKLVRYPTGYELYNLTADPRELQNIYSTAPKRLVNDLKVVIEMLRVCKGPSCLI